MNNPANLTSGRLLARNTMINLTSEVIPFLVAIVAIPAIIGGIGVDRYGVLTLCIMAVGYFGLFDLGLGRAATKFISDAAASGDRDSIPELFWTALTVMAALGAAASVLVAVIAPWTVGHLLRIPPALRPESLRAFYLLALSMSLVISGACFRGTLSAFQRFDLINLVRVPAAVLSYLAPLMVLPFSHRIDAMVAAMVAVRVAGWFASYAMCIRVLPGLRRPIRPRLAALRPMLCFGGWVTLSNVVGPIIVYFDRFLIGAMLSMAAVAYYAVPYQVVFKLCIIPGAVTGVVFSAFSGTFHRDRARTELVFTIATKYVLLALFPFVLLIVVFAPEGLRFWLGAAFVRNSTEVLRWLALAAFANSLAHPPYALIQAANRPDILAKLHVAEIPIYLPLVWWMLTNYGILGVAIAWAIRVLVTSIIVFLVALWLLPSIASALSRIATLAVTASIALALSTLPSDPVQKVLFASAAMIAIAATAWLTLDAAEKDSARGFLQALRVLPAQTTD